MSNKNNRKMVITEVINYSSLSLAMNKVGGGTTGWVQQITRQLLQNWPLER
jgi:hypothetical protein